MFNNQLSFRCIVIFNIAAVLMLASNGCKSAARKQMESQFNLKILWAAVISYQSKNGKWPDTLEDARSEIGQGSGGSLANGRTFDDIMINPITGDKPGYEFAKPAGGLLSQSNDPIIYQLRDGKRDESLDVAFRDGTVRKVGSASSY